MPRQLIENRLDGLELRVSELEKLPERVSAVESQIVQLRTEMHSGFSAVRRELGDLRGEMAERFEETHRHIRVLHEDVISRLALVHEGQKRRKRPNGR